MKAVFLDRDSLDCDDLDFSPIKQVVDQWCEYSSTSEALVESRASDADILVVNKQKMTAPLLRKLKQLKLICVAATGTNNVDLKTATELGITVSNCQAYGTGSVVQHVFSLMLALSTRLLQYHQAVQTGRWNLASQFCLLDYPIQELSGKVLGIIGYGELGKNVARIAQAFGMEVMIAERVGEVPRPGRHALEDMLPMIDILTIHCPLTEETRNLIAKDELRLIKRGALLINASRGGVVNEIALVDALESDQLAGAGVDVLTEEPPKEGNPLLDCNHPNLIITPHSAWGSFQARQRIVCQLAENIRAHLEGKPVRVVNS
ncbi:2-hydroxyacid dehydrogenase [Motiliproteus sp. MSK22-1]|uniref:2-hydroxyacid dehydrogenase n=1 Tax=Motiliproteus sp. MSK22-1 TaxID=1897630 RepID=UPI0009753DAA|nr:2-hydroxyacid dehydrogenase [Motiliproteus sp. MSK22-1]OMH38798.1 glycerate dehydrogenase [Motiliproteus sp. MSK22-1]